jgi:hypothetical protein
MGIQTLMWACRNFPRYTTETWHYKYVQIEAVTGCLFRRLRFSEFALISGNCSGMS